MSADTQNARSTIRGLLGKTDPALLEKLDRAVAAFNALSPDQREAMVRRQLDSWVRGEMGMGSDRDEAEYRARLAANEAGHGPEGSAQAQTEQPNHD